MRTLIYSLAAVFTLLFLVSCEKEDSFPQKLQKVRFEEGKVRMFTNKGEVSDAAVIGKFIKRIDDDIYSLFKSHISLDSNFVEYNSCNFEIEIASKSRARILTSDGKVQEFTLQRQAGALFFVKDTTVATPFPLTTEWLKFKPAIVKEEPTWGGTMTFFKPTIFAYEANGEIHFPIVSCIVTKKPLNSIDTGYQSWFLRQNNSISDEYLAKIAVTNSSIDTIVFRESRIVFK